MRLTTLDPRWYTVTGGIRAGLTFVCPHCWTVRLGVAFHPAGRDAINAVEPDTHGPTRDALWSISGQDGDSFDHITVHPSVDASGAGHWHGYIKDGEVT